MKPMPLLAFPTPPQPRNCQSALDHLLTTVVTIDVDGSPRIMTVLNLLERAWIERHYRYGGFFSRALGTIGLRVVEEESRRSMATLLIDPTNRMLDRVFENTPWQGIPPAILLRSVNGAPRRYTVRTVRIGAKAVRAQLVPLGLGKGP